MDSFGCFFATQKIKLVMWAQCNLLVKTLPIMYCSCHLPQKHAKGQKWLYCKSISIQVTTHFLYDDSRDSVSCSTVLVISTTKCNSFFQRIHKNQHPRRLHFHEQLYVKQSGDTPLNTVLLSGTDDEDPKNSMYPWFSLQKGALRGIPAQRVILFHGLGFGRFH